ncbi:MAG: helix-hairpin-helix motif [Rariglobus sp.]|jgi:N-glycosylase/DNA lyase|nr:helix-hairpin-helix motif [Rariglobus sp.]
MPAGWTAFQTLSGAPRLTAATLAELVDGGQAFRWQREADGLWLGIWSDQIVRLRLSPAGDLEWSAPAKLAARVRTALPVYLFGHDTAKALDTLPWRSDAHLSRCLAAFPGLTILRQPFGETLLGFLCSATKQIVQIKQMVALLAGRHGAPIIPTPPSRSPSQPRQVCHLLSDKPALGSAPPVNVSSINRLPTWGELADVSETDLRACLLGFRARYIHQTAQFLAAHPGWLDKTERLPYLEAKARLCELPGVGEKVADCVLLFGAGRLEAFPVDTWIIKAMARRYALDGWAPAQIAHFGRVHFGAYAGLAQQYLFAYERAQAKSTVPLS